jgi:hypothetical protein
MERHYRVRLKVAAVSIFGFTILPACLEAKTVLADSQENAKEVFVAEASGATLKSLSRPGVYLTADEVK